MGVVLPQPIQFGKYTLFERIGRGGMADVFKGRVQGPAGFERVFVVKRILPHLSDDPTFTTMFAEEAKLSARLSHPNIVQVFELGNVDAEFFISMEYVRGRDLAETMRTLWARIGPPRPELVAYVGREMCRALAYAHDLTGEDGEPLGMIHRDVSPSNVMLSYEGAVKILDFGIAKALAGESQEESGTQRGTLKGKFAYMAPEQTQGSSIDRRIDIFATGIVLHEILTGRRLFKGENDLQTVEKVRQCDVLPPSLQNPLCPPELDAIVLKALARYRDDRFQSAADLADALDDVVHAARFQPSHLAHLMRELFPADVGGGDVNRTTSSARVTQSLTGSSSRPYTPPMRSPTIPPASRSVSGVRTGSSSAPAEISTQAAVKPKPLLKRGSVWAMAGLLAVAFAGGAVFMRSSSPPQVATAPSVESRPRVIPLEFVIQSLPDGADVHVLNTNEALGKTPLKRKFEWREDRPIILVFRLKGYEELTREVKPTWTGFVTLRPQTGGQPRSTDTPVIIAPASAPAPDAAAKEALSPSTLAPPTYEPTPTPPPRPSRSSTGSDSSRRRISSGTKKPKGSNELVNPF